MNRSASVPKIGIFGGTFDPVHNGHLHIANKLREALDLDRVIWVPAGRPPHKQGQIVSSDQDRLAMLELALTESPDDAICTVELERSGPSYTADTLESLRERLAPARLVFLMGEDSLRDLPTWRAPERILAAADIAVAGRPGIDADLEAITRALPALRGRVHVIPMEELAISSSEIRRLVSDGQSVDGLVPAPVAEYVQQRGLYGAAGSNA